MIVIDASACVDLALENSPAALLEALIDGRHLHAPDILDLEVTSALARIERSDGASAQRVGTALRDFGDLPVRRHSSRPLVAAAWSLRRGLRVSDAYYVALARRLGAPLLTTDGRLERGRPADVEVLAVSWPTRSPPPGAGPPRAAPTSPDRPAPAPPSGCP